MSDPIDAAGLAGYFDASCADDDTIGVEVELLTVDADDGRPAGARHVQRVVDATAGAMSIEAPGQVEIRTAPARSIAELAAGVDAAVTQASEQLAREQVLALGLGFQPFASLIDAADGERAQVMSADDLVLRMAAALHVSVSYRDEHDARRKMIGARALTAPFVALFGNSPLVHGRAGGASMRALVWRSAFAAYQVPDALLAEPEGFFARYARWTAALPAWGAGAGHEVTFDRWMAGAGERLPDLADWQEHLRIPARDVRLKSIVELRCFDSVPVEGVVAAAAMVRGLLCDPDNLASLVAEPIAAVEREDAIGAAARTGLAEPAVTSRLEALVARAAAGLERRGEDAGALGWARRALEARRNWGQTIAASWTEHRGNRPRFLRDVARRTCGQSLTAW